MLKSKRVSKPTAMTSGVRNILEKKSFGEEPTFPKGLELTQTQLIAAMNWYNYMCERSDAIEYLKAYYTSRDPSRLKKINQIDQKYLSTSYGWVARLLDNGHKINKLTIDKIDSHVDLIFSKYVKPKGEVNANAKSTTDKNEFLIGDIEEMLDAGTKDVYQYLTKNSVPKNQISRIVEYYTPILVEVQSVVATKDTQLKEGYRSYKPKDLKALQASIQSIISDCERYSDNKATERKPRKKKIIPADKKVVKVQYMDRFDKLQLVSKPPTCIIGAKELWLFDSKYNTLTHLVSDTGMDVKGTTIINLNLEKSSKKNIGRKVKETLEVVLTGGKITLRKLMNDIKSKSIEATGRINSNVLILKSA